VRMVFVGDVIPPELQRVVEFLNEQMDRAEVLAVELRYYRAGDLTTLVPRVVGLTAKAQQMKGRPEKATAQDMLEHMRANYGDKAPLVVSRITDWARSEKLNPLVQAGKAGPTLWLGLYAGGASYWPIRLRPDGKLVISLQVLKAREPFSDDALRSELVDRLNKIPGVSVPPELRGKPSIPIELLQDDRMLTEVISVLTWIMRTIRKHAEAIPPSLQNA
jgi:hypothetical protein